MEPTGHCQQAPKFLLSSSSMTIFATYPADGPTPAPRQRKKVISHKRHLDLCWQKAESHRQTREGNDPLRREPRARASGSVCTRFPARCRSQVKWNTDDSPAGTPYSHVCPEAALPGRAGAALSRHTGTCAPRHGRPEEDREEPSTCVTGGGSKQASGGANRRCPPRCQAAGQSLLKAFKMVGFGERNLF